MIIKAWVTPRYLDNKWFKQFTVSLYKSKSTDIPVVVSVNDKSYEGSMFNNDVESYGDLLSRAQELEAKNEQLAEQLKETRKHLTESVAKECKCEVNISVNNDLVNRNLGLKQQLKEANEVAKFYGKKDSWNKDSQDYGSSMSTLWQITGKDLYEQNEATQYGGKTARQYLIKYKVKE
tara:strand:- start:185 stop:718 length:534 start_codon:yes stop_codon:yes gene_type:complete